MKKYFIQIVLLILLASCRENDIKKPVWINPSAILSIPADSLIFNAAGTGWKVSLLSFTQPVPLSLYYTNSGFIVSAKNKYGITEGPAKIVLSKSNQYYYYPVNLLNKDASPLTEKDYRSPKTLNPDSGLQQHRMIYSIDKWRNLLNPLQQPGYFSEEMISITPVAGVYRAQNDQPISAFYVLPGSAINIPVKAEYLKQENVFTVFAGPLKDKHNNFVANGTMVSFIYTDGLVNYRMDSELFNGYAIAHIPAATAKRFTLTAKVNDTHSSPLQLIAR